MGVKKNYLMWVVWVSIPLAVLMILAVGGAVGYLIYFDGLYDQARSALDAHEYTDALDKLAAVPAFYQETGDFTEYARAGEALEKGEFEKARGLFIKLDGYRDSAELIREADYRQAKAHLAGSRHQEAMVLLDGLSKGSYRDSAELLLEAQYGLAGSKLQAGEYKEASELLQRLSVKDYKDSAELAQKANYHYALDLYHAKNFTEAQKLFTDLKDYEKSGTYLILTQLQLKQFTITSYAGRKAALQKLFKLSKDEDIIPLLVSDDWIYYLLEGRWIYKENNFEMVHNGGDSWTINYELPHITGQFFKIENSIVYLGNDQAGWNKCFELKFETERIVKVFCFKDGSEYKLYRSTN